MTVALDAGGADAVRPFIEAAQPEHPSLIDTAHVVDERLGVVNVPNSVWIDEYGTIVRPAEPASVERSALRDMDIPEGLPDDIRDVFIEAKAIRDDSAEYRAAIYDWVEHGADSEYALSPDEVIERSQPRGHDQAAAAAAFELGLHFQQQGDHAGAVQWWREAHRFDPHNWTYKRQAWSIETTQPGELSDMVQGPTDVYEGNWAADVKRLGGGENYYPAFQP